MKRIFGAAAVAVLAIGTQVQATTAIGFDYSFSVTSTRTVVNDMPGTPTPLPSPYDGTGHLTLTLGNPTDSFGTGTIPGATLHSVSYAVSFSSIDYLPGVLPLSVPAGFPPKGGSVTGRLVFSRNEIGGAATGSGAWNLDDLTLLEGEGSSIFTVSTFTVDAVSRSNLIRPLFGLFDTSFADLAPSTIAHGLASYDKCYTPTLCIPYNLFGYSIRNATEQRDIDDGIATSTAEVAFGMLELRNPVVAVPEPGTWAMLITGFALLGGVARRRSWQGATARG